MSQHMLTICPKKTYFHLLNFIAFQHYKSNFEDLIFRPKIGINLYMNDNFVEPKFKQNGKD